MSEAGENILKRIADRMTQDALARPGETQKRAFKNEAVVSLCFYRENGVLELTISRRGLSPMNDFSSNGAKRRATWETECKTFARAFGAPANANRTNGARGEFYWMVYQFGYAVHPNTTQTEAVK